MVDIKREAKRIQGKYLPALAEKIHLFVSEVEKRRGKQELTFIFDEKQSREFAESISELLRVNYHNIIKLIHVLDLGKRNINNAIYIDCIFDKNNVEYIEKLESISSSPSAALIGIIYPTGYDFNSGSTIKKEIIFNVIFTLSAPLSIYLNDCLDSCQRIEELDPLMPKEYHLVSSTDFEIYFRPRKRNTHKGTYLTTSIIGGCKEYSGAPVLAYSSLAALKMGCGFSYLVIPEELRDLYLLRQPQAIVKSLPSSEGNFKFLPSAVDEIMRKSDVIVFGMGVGVHRDNYLILKYLLENFSGRLVIDADGLNCLAKFGVSILNNHIGEVVLTPHLKEFSRLIAQPLEKVVANGVELSKQFARKYGLVVLLKSASSIITDGERLSINISGNAGLAKAGSGDLLSGLVGGLLSNTELSPFLSASLGSFLLGKLAEDASEKVYQNSLTYDDIVSQIGKTLKKLEKITCDF